MKVVLTIAGSDSSGGAGIQADIKTITAHGMFAVSAITALTAQNTTGVRDVLEASPKFVAEQIDAIFDDIRPDAVKIGMVSSADIIREIAAALRRHGAKNIVADPVMVATSGSRLISEDAASVLIGELLCMADVITPNIPEAEVLSGMAINAKDDMMAAARKIAAGISGAVLIKGGHSDGNADDLLYCKNGSSRWYSAKRIPSRNTHGTGCTLSSAIACNLADGVALPDAIANAKGYVTRAIAAAPGFGHGCGPLNHMVAAR